MDQGTGGYSQRVSCQGAHRAEPTSETEISIKSNANAKADKHEMPPPGHPVAWATPPAAAHIETRAAARQSGPTRFVKTYDFASRIKTNPIIVRRPSVKTRAASAPAGGQN